MSEADKNEEKPYKIYKRPLDDVDDDEEKKEQQDDKFYAEYFAITTERRARLQEIMKKADDVKFQVAKSTKSQYTITDDCTFKIEHRVTYSKMFKNEPTVWMLETIMPGTPETFIKYWGEAKHRVKWDTQIASFQKIELYKDDKTWLEVMNNTTNPAVGGLISPREFTDVVQIWKLENGLEIASQSVNYKGFPSKKGFVTGWNTLYGQRITLIDAEELMEKYNVPELQMQGNNDGGDAKILRWCKCQYILQTDIKGWLPTSVVETGISGGLCATFEMYREYMLREVLGLDVKIVKL